MFVALVDPATVGAVVVVVALMDLVAAAKIKTKANNAMAHGCVQRFRRENVWNHIDTVFFFSRSWFCLKFW